MGAWDIDPNAMSVNPPPAGQTGIQQLMQILGPIWSGVKQGAPDFARGMGLSPIMDAMPSAETTARLSNQFGTPEIEYTGPTSLHPDSGAAQLADVLGSIANALKGTSKDMAGYDPGGMPTGQEAIGKKPQDMPQGPQGQWQGQNTPADYAEALQYAGAGPSVGEPPPPVVNGVPGGGGGGPAPVPGGTPADYPLSPSLIAAMQQLANPIQHEEPQYADPSMYRDAVAASYPGPAPSTGILDVLAGALGGAAQGALVSGTGRGAGAGALLGGLGAGRDRKAAYAEALAKYNENLVASEGAIFEDTTEYNIELNSQRAQNARASRKSLEELVQVLDPTMIVANNRIIVGSVDPDTNSYRTQEYTVNPILDALAQANVAKAWRDANAPYPNSDDKNDTIDKEMEYLEYLQEYVNVGVEAGSIPAEVGTYLQPASWEVKFRPSGAAATAARSAILADLESGATGMFGEAAELDDEAMENAMIIKLAEMMLNRQVPTPALPPE